jgi:membrane fusion protein, multidrug efflux system
MALANTVELDWLVTSMSHKTDPYLLWRKIILRRSFVAALCAFFAVLAAGCSNDATIVAPRTVAAEQKSSARSPAPVQQVADSRREAGSGRYSTSGPLVVDQQADVAAGRDGRVVRILVEMGQQVHEGQVLAELDDKMQRAELAGKQARLSSLHNQVKEWEAEEKSVEADLRRADKMRADKIVSEEDWEHIKYKLDEIRAEVARYQADEEAARSDIQAAEVQLALSQIRAPFSGVIGRRSVRDAQELKRGDVLFWLTAQKPLRILFTVPEISMAGFVAGAPLELTTADFPSLCQTARILRVSPVVDPSSGSIQVIGLVDSPSHLLKPGMSMQVRLAQ